VAGTGGSSPSCILFSTLDSAWAGAQAQMLELAAGLNRDEFVPVVLTTNAGGGALAEHSRDLGIATYVLPHSWMRRTFPFVPHYVIGPVALRRLLARERVRLVHAHDPHSAQPIMRAAIGLNLPLVCHVHDFDQRWVTRRTLRLQNAPRGIVVAISDATSRYVMERGVHPTHVRRIYNGVHLAPLGDRARTDSRRELGLSQNEIGVALVGRFVERKGQEPLIRAMACPALANLPVRAFLIGRAEAPERAYDQELRTLVSQLGLTNRVVFAGHRDDAPSLLAGMDISVVPSRREAFGRVVVEALHAGTPVIVYREGGLPELVRHEVEGLVVEPDDVEGFAAAIARLASDAPLRARLGVNARARAQDFTHERFVANMTALYRQLLATPNLRTPLTA
jgi:glycosyltransferase involved in cell wall biosynthesis